MDLKEGADNNNSSRMQLPSRLYFYLLLCLKKSWKDRTPDEQVLRRMLEEEIHFRRNTVEQKVAYVGHVTENLVVLMPYWF